MDIKLLDYFAAQALGGITSQLIPPPSGFLDDAAAVAYQYALAMMRERREVLLAMMRERRENSVKRSDDEIDAQLDADTDKKEDEWLASES